MYFQPDGLVRACCTTFSQFGRIRPGGEGPTLRQLWDGSAAEVQREALDQADFSNGCQECEVAIAQGNRADSLASHFDRYVQPRPLPFPAMMDFALSNRCNLQCTMCNGELSSTIRAKREGRDPLPSAYDDRFFEELREFLPHLERAQFKGGEPFLSPEAIRVWDLMIETGWQGEILVTTNATVWNERVEHYVRTLGMTVIASVDAVTPSVLEAIRVGVDASKLWRNIDRFQEAVADTGQHVLLSMCHMVQNWAELGPFLAEADRRDVDANVILVNQPFDHSLLDLPPAALADIVDRLGDEDARRRATLGRNRPIWDAQLQRLRAHLGSPVQIRPSTWRPTMSASRAAERVRQLAERSDTEPLILVITEDRLGRHPSDAPAWADALGLAEWAGASVGDLESLARQTIAETITISVELDEDAAYQVAIELPAGHASGIRSLHGSVLPPVPHGQDQALVLAATLAS